MSINSLHACYFACYLDVCGFLKKHKKKQNKKNKNIFSQKIKHEVHNQCVYLHFTVFIQISVNILSDLIGIQFATKRMAISSVKRSKYEPQHEISYNVVNVCATSKGSDQPAHTRSLIRAFASRLIIL